MGMPVDLEYKTAAVATAPAGAESGEAAVFDPAQVPDDAHEVTAVIAVTGVRDDVGDVIVPGAFERSLRERPKPKVCLGHDWNRPIGKTAWIRELRPGDSGLPKKTFDGKPWPAKAGAVIARYIPDMSKKDGKDAYDSAKFFGTEESTFSFGYKTRTATHRDGTRYIHDLDMYEYGPVLIPANRLATLQDIKAGVDVEDVETKAKVRDVAYWGEPYGTPITAGMHPHGPKARAERREGRVPSRSVGTMPDRGGPAAAPKIGKTERAAEQASTGLFAEPASDARVLPHPTRAKGKDQQHLDNLARQVVEGAADEEASDEDRAAIDKAVRGLLDEAITPNEMRDRLASHPLIAQGRPQRERDQGGPGLHDEAANRVATDYAARYAALAPDQRANAPAPVPAERFDNLDDAQLAAHRAATEQILAGMTERGIGPSNPGYRQAAAHLAGANEAIRRRAAGEADHPAVARAARRGAELRARNSEQAGERADALERRLGEIQAEQQRRPAEPGSPEARLPHQIRAMIGGLRSTETDMASRPGPATVGGMEAAAPERGAQRALTDLSDAELIAEVDKASRAALRAGNVGNVGDQARARIRRIREIQAQREDASRRQFPAHSLGPQDYRAAQDRALSARFQQKRQARENEQANKVNATIDETERIAATAPERITHIPTGHESAGDGRLTLSGAKTANWALHMADGRTVIHANHFARLGTDRKAKLNRGQINSLATELANIRDANGHRIPTTAPNIEQWGPGFRDAEGHDTIGAIGKVVRDWASRNGLGLSSASLYRHPSPPRGRPTRTDLPDEQGFYPRQRVEDLAPGDHVRLPDGSAHPLERVLDETHGPGGGLEQPRSHNITLRFTDGTSHNMGEHRREIDVRYAGGVSPSDPARARDPGMGYTAASAIGTRPSELRPEEAQRIQEGLRGTPEPGTRFVRPPSSSSAYADSRARAGVVTDRVAYVEGDPARVVEYDDGTFDAITPAGMAKMDTSPDDARIRDARQQWGLPPEPPRLGERPGEPPAERPGEPPVERPGREPRLVDVGPAANASAAAHATALARMTPEQATRHAATLSPATLRQVDTKMAQRATALNRPGQITPAHQAVRDALAARPAPARPVARRGSRQVPGAPYTVIRKGARNATVEHQGTRYDVNYAGGERGVAGITITGPNGEKTFTPGGSNDLPLTERHADVERAIREGLSTAHAKRAPGTITAPGATTVRIDQTALDEAAAARDAALGLREHPDGHIELNPEVADRQDRVAALLDRHQAGTLNLPAASTDELRGHQADLTGELRLQHELARRDASRLPARPVAGTTRGGRSVPATTRPGLAGAAQDHADALRSGDTEAVARTRQRLDSSIRRSRAGSEAARAIADHVAAGGTNAEHLNTLAETLRADARARRNASVRKQRTARRLDRERINSLLGSVDTELRDRAMRGAPDRTPATPLTDAEYEKHTRSIEDKLDAAFRAGRSTDVTHTLGGKGTIYTSERAEQHKQIVDAIWARHGVNVPREGRSVIAGGLGGAGKSTVLREHAGIRGEDYLTINPDDVKEELAGRGMIPQVEGLSPMEASALVHEESSHVANLLARRAYKNRTNVTWDITMSRRESVHKRMQEMADHGYTTPDGVFVDIPVETSVQRALARHRRGMERYRNGEGTGGRYVPPSIIRKAAHSTKSSANRDTFDQLASQFGSSAVFDNSRHGEEPRKIEGTGRWGVGESGLATFSERDTPEQRHSKLAAHYTWLHRNQNADRDYRNPKAVEESLKSVGAPLPSFADEATPAHHTQIAEMWPKLREGTEHIAAPGIHVVDLSGAKGSNELARERGVAAQYTFSSKRIDISPETLATGQFKHSGFFIPSGNSTFAERSLHHEYGHHLAMALEKENYEAYQAMHRLIATEIKRGNGHGKAKRIDSKAAAEIDGIGRTTHPNVWITKHSSAIVQHVGTYAGVNHRELSAELWAEYRLSPHPSPAAQVAGEFISRRRTV